MSHQNNENKKNIIGNMKASFSGRKFRSGAYVSILSVVVVVIVLVINMIVSNFDLKVDVSTQSLYTLSKDTQTLVKNLKDDITIYYLAEAGKENQTLYKVAEKYDSLSDKISLESKDPVLYPKFAAQYVDDNVTSDSIILVNKGNNRAKYIPYSDMLVQELNQQTYQMQTTGIDVEGEITSAIQYVTNPDLPKMYVVDGHGEAKPGSAFDALMAKQNIDVESISTLTQGSIPEDCDVLYINAPSNDFSEDEVNMIKDYMNRGGNVLITLNYLAEDLTNFKSLVNYYGVDLVPGFICEGNANMHLPNYPHFIVPNIDNHDITANATRNKKYVVTPTSTGMQIQDSLRSSLTVEPLLTTSDSAYSKVDINTNTASKEADDVDGPFQVGVVATDKYSEKASHMVVYSSASIFEDAPISSTQGYGNADILTGTLGYLVGDTSVVTIASKSIMPEQIFLTAQQGILWGALAVVIIPVIILVAGVVVTLKRRRK